MLSLREARRISSPVVYGIADRRSEIIVYVGKTKNPRNRFSKYLRPEHCHNPELAKWLRAAGQNAGVKILADDPADLGAEERRWIKALSPGLFNLVHGGEQSWRNHQSRPWMAPTGIKCPSALALLRLAKNGSKAEEIAAIRSARETMSVEERVLYEVGICHDLWFMFEAQFRKWLAYTADRIDPYVNAATARAV